MEKANEPPDERTKTWLSLIAFAIEERTAYLVANNLSDLSREQAIAAACFAMFHRGLQIGVAFSQLDPGLARTVYDGLTLAGTNPNDPPEVTRMSRMEHLQAVERFKRFLSGQEEFPWTNDQPAQ